MPRRCWRGGGGGGDMAAAAQTLEPTPSCFVEADFAPVKGLFSRWGGDQPPAPPPKHEPTAEEQVHALAHTAVSVAFLQDFYETCVAPLPGGAALTTKQVVESIIKPWMRVQPRFSWADRLPLAVGAPHAFASHAFSGAFSLLVTSLAAHFRDAVPSECYIWVDIFVINQHMPDKDLHEGRTLAATIDVCATVAVVLDAATTPLTRLWCLYEIGSTPPEKLQLLTHGFDAALLAAAFQRIDVANADCFAQKDKEMIRRLIRTKHASLDAFTRLLKLLLVLRPTSYAGDVAALLARSSDDVFEFGALRAFLAQGGGRLACVAGGPGEGKSTLAAMMVTPPAHSGGLRLLCCGGGGGASAPLVQVAHFCKAADVRRQDVGAVVRSLAYQLALTHAPFARRLLALTPAEIELLQSSPAEAYRLLLKAPLEACDPRRLRAVVLLDALDEAAVAGRAVSPVLRLLLDLGGLRAGGAAGLSFVVTARPEEALLAPLRSRWGDRLRLFRPDQLRRHAAGHHATGGGDANHVASPLLRTLAAASPGGATPASLDVAYAALFFGGGGGGAAALAAHATALSVLVASRQPQSVAELEAMRLRAALRCVPGWDVLFVERDSRLHFLHRSVAEWLVAHGGVDVAAGHALLAEHLWAARLAPWLFPRPGQAPQEAPPEGAYAHGHAVAHLVAAGRTADARALPLRLPWLQATLRERGLKALLDDVAALAQPDDGTLTPLLAVLRLSAPALLGLDAPSCLPAQLCGRLRGDSLSPQLAALLAEAAAWRGDVAWLRPVTSTLRTPGVLENTLVCTTGAVTCLALLPSGRIASGSDDRGVHLWNADTGECEATLAGHTEPVYGVAALSDTRIVSGSYDATLRVWDVDTGACERVLSGHEDRINAVTVLPDGRVASASYDATVRIWRPDSGECVLILRGHTGSVWALALLPDGRLVSSANDATLKIWDLPSGACTATLSGHSDGICGLTVLPDGRAVSGSRDSTLRVWDTSAGACERTLTGHGDEIYAAAALGGARVASGSLDKSVRLWDVDTGACVAVLSGHTDTVLAVARLPNGRLLSGSEDKTMRVWGPANAAKEPPPTGHAACAAALAALPDGRLVSASHDRTLKLWNAASGACEATLTGHAEPVNALAVLADGRVVSGAGFQWNVYNRTIYDNDTYALNNTLRMWQPASGACEAAWNAHAKALHALAVLPDGRLVSASEDRTLKVWNPSTWACEATLSGHASFINAAVVLPGGRIASRTFAADYSARYGASFAACNRSLETRLWTQQRPDSAWRGELLAEPSPPEIEAALSARAFPYEGSFVLLPDTARLYCDAAVTAGARACGGTRYVITAADGGVHFCELVPPAKR